MRNIEKGQSINKQYSVSLKSINDEKKIITFLGTTNSKDRDGDIIVPEGGSLENFRKNPIFLWGHDWAGERLPIGRSEEERIVKNKGIEFDIKFDEKDEFALQVYNKYKNNFLNAVSIGFSINDYERMTDDNDNLIGFKFTDWELLELSAVPIPANPEALQRMVKSAQDDIEKQVKKMAEQVKYVPNNVSIETASEDTEWDAPDFEDFNMDEERFVDLSESDKRYIAGHFAFSINNPPETYGDLKLPHHRPSDGAIVWRGVANAAARLPQTDDIPDTDIDDVQSHLGAHYEQFDKVPPWEEEEDTEPEESKEKETKFSVNEIKEALNILAESENNKTNKLDEPEDDIFDILEITDKTVRKEIKYLAGEIVD